MKFGVHLGLLILRISAGVLMLFHGIAKIPEGVGFIQDTLVENGWPGWFAYGVYIGEIIAPLLLIVGWRTRFAAFIYAFNILFATLLVHSEDLFTIGQHGGWAVELQALYFIAAFVLVFTGGGKFAVSKSSFGD